MESQAIWKMAVERGFGENKRLSELEAYCQGLECENKRLSELDAYCKELESELVVSKARLKTALEENLEAKMNNQSLREHILHLGGKNPPRYADQTRFSRNLKEEMDGYGDHANGQKRPPQAMKQASRRSGPNIDENTTWQDQHETMYIDHNA